MATQNQKPVANTRELATRAHRLATGEPPVSVKSACEFVGIGRSTYYTFFPKSTNKKGEEPASSTPRVNYPTAQGEALTAKGYPNQSTTTPGGDK